MSARSRAEARLTRPVPDFHEWESREPACRVAGRDKPAPEPRAVPGDDLRVRVDAIREMRFKAPARPTPNAPLLMRIVRTPYVLERVRNAKLRLIEPFVKVPRERLGRPDESHREALAALALPSPMRSISHRPDPRPRPFRRRIEGETP